MTEHKTFIMEKPWGKFEQFTHNEISTVKILTVKPEEHLSLQYHHKREEFWRVIKGKLIVTIGDKKINAKEGDEFFIPKEAKHTAEGIGEEEAKILEISYGEFDEEDIVRLEDKYGRAD